MCETDKQPLITKVTNSTTAKDLYLVYSKAVGHKTYNGKPLPKYSELGGQQVGWIAMADVVVAGIDANTAMYSVPPGA